MGSDRLYNKFVKEIYVSYETEGLIKNLKYIKNEFYRKYTLNELKFLRAFLNGYEKKSYSTLLSFALGAIGYVLGRGLKFDTDNLFSQLNFFGFFNIVSALFILYSIIRFLRGTVEVNFKRNC